ncbi:MAG: hypothetical protein Q7V31_12055 [Parvibaculum sp.]|uniref:virion core protein, T7 gp14 family n=1 Tax=Parvibaculum sp. TaxID=2024848 RepID=UPI002721C7F9|nr:hypothetical protein [Parvibaculum sp.]MDO8839650.1 hypothetical protein [Parvibaculum sp.]
MSAASAIGSIVSQSAAQKAQDAQQQQNTLNAQQAFVDNINQSNAALGQQDQQEADNTTATQREGARRRATVATSAGEAGTGGLSVKALMDDFSAAENRLIGASQRQTQWNRTGAVLQLDGAKTTMQNRINSVPKGTAPDYFGAAMKLGGEAFTANQTAGAK